MGAPESIRHGDCDHSQKGSSIQHPVMLAGMAGVASADLVVAVCEAGGFGCLGAATMTTGQMVQEIRAVRARTGRAFGVDLLTAMPGDLTGQVEHIIADGIRSS